MIPARGGREQVLGALGVWTLLYLALNLVGEFRDRDVCHEALKQGVMTMRLQFRNPMLRSGRVTLMAVAAMVGINMLGADVAGARPV